MRRIALLVVLAACGGGRTGSPETQVAGDTAPSGPVTPRADTTYPVARRGLLIARAAHPSPFDGEWRAAAGLCAEPPSFHLLALGDSIDLMIRLRSPAEGWVPGVFVVTAPEDTTDAPGTARLGLGRVFYEQQAFRGQRGSVELSRVEGRVSGRFDAVLVDLNSTDTLRYLGVFDGIPVDPLPPDQCQAAAQGLPPGVH